MNFNLEQTEFFDMFNSEQTPQKEKVTFSNENTEVNMFTQTEVTPPVETKEPNAPVDTKGEGEEEVDLFEGEAAVEKKTKDDIYNINTFFQKKIEDGFFSPLMDDDGNDVVLEKPEDYEALIEANINYKLEQKAQEVEQNWYKSKNPVWQMVAKYSEVVEDPSELVPYLQGIQTIVNVSNIDETTIDGAEQIVRYQKEKNGVPKDVIDEEIDALKQTDKLISAASKVKPILVQDEQKALVQMESDARQREEDYVRMVYDYQMKAVETIEKPLFGQKLKQDEKAIVYDLIGSPNPQIGDYAIHAIIDELFRKGDFETLTQAALLLGKKDSFFKYAQNSTKQSVAEGLQRKLRVQAESGIKSTGNDDPEVKITKIPQSYGNKGGKIRFGQ